MFVWEIQHIDNIVHIKKDQRFGNFVNASKYDDYNPSFQFEFIYKRHDTLRLTLFKEVATWIDGSTNSGGWSGHGVLNI